MIKKMLKIALWLIVIAAVLLAGGLITLKIMFPPEKIKAEVLAMAKNQLGREVSFDSVSFRLVGISLDNFAMSEASTFESGTFARAKNLVAKVALRPLFKKDIQISTIGLEGFEANIVANADGSFNFDDITKRFAAAPADSAPNAAKKEADNSPLPFTLEVDDFYIKDSAVTYTDKASGMTAAVSNINVKVKGFALDGDFTGDASAQIAYSDATMKANVPLSAEFGANLADMDLTKASATLKKMVLEYNGAKATFSGSVKNFNAPSVNFNGVLSGISEKTAADFASDLPKFALPDINFSTQAEVNLDKSSANVKSFKTNVKNSTANASGAVSWAKDLAYNFKADFNFILSELGDIAPDMLKGFGITDITGTMGGAFNIKTDTITGALDMNGAGLAYKPVADVRDVTGKIEILSLASVKSDGITGTFNGGKFNTDFSFAEAKTNLYNVVFNMDLDKLIIKELPASAASSEAQSVSASAASSSAPGPKFNVKATAKVGEIDIPFFISQSADLTADLTNADATLHSLSGSAKFNVAHSTVTDLDAFIKSNKIARVGFISLKIIKSVSDVLKLDIFPAKHTDYPKGIQITSMTGDYAFNNGLMTIKDTSINADLSTIKADGTADFKTEKLNMRGYTHIGRQGSSGFKPVVIKIGGTMSDPKGSLDVLATAVSVVPGVTGAGAGAVKDVADAAKNAVSSLSDLFKKK